MSFKRKKYIDDYFSNITFNVEIESDRKSFDKLASLNKGME